ncbi:MAG: sensor histidine kinase [Pyrinomonadaceae bacterium]
MHQVPYKRPLKTGREMNAGATEGEFLTIVSHELRTPTAAILGWAELLGRTALNDERLAHGIEIIKRNAQLQAQLIEHLIDFTRISKDDFKLDLQKIAILPTLKAAVETMMPLALAKDIKIATRLEPVSGWIVGDTFRLQQVFTNLISNAIRFTPAGGHIRVLLADDGTSVEVRVSDTGRGISAECLPDIFNGFRQEANRSATEPGGLGLGLNISRRLIERHGGRIDAFSNGKGQGATFAVHLPRADVNVD